MTATDTLAEIQAIIEATRRLDARSADRIPEGVGYPAAVARAKREHAEMAFDEIARVVERWEVLR